jgi:AraC-like DNA-binding protein
LDAFPGFALERTLFGSARFAEPWSVSLAPNSESHCYVVLGKGAWFHAPAVHPHPIWCTPGSSMSVAPEKAHSWRSDLDVPLGNVLDEFPIRSSRLPTNIGPGEMQTTILVGRAPIWSLHFFVVDVPIIFIPADAIPEMTRILAYLEQIDDFLRSQETDIAARAAVLRLSEILVYETMRYWMKTAPNSLAYPMIGVADPHIFRALRTFHRQLERNWTTDELARIANLGRSVFIARFKKITGRTPRDYMRYVRLRMAPLLMRDPKRSLGDIADAVGYGSEASFIRAFSREFQMTPGEFQRRSRDR